MAEAYVDFTPETAALADIALPLGVVVVSRGDYGGAVRVNIQGDALDAGKAYQVIITDEPLKRTFELRLAGAPNA